MQTDGKRVFYFDNAKFILILCVVIGHFISPYSNDNQFLNVFYKWMYTFHMPAFILISGYFAKSFMKKRNIKDLALKLLLPYIIFQIIFTCFFTMNGEEVPISLFEPQWTLWFLLSLFSWYLLLILFVKLPYPFIISIILGTVIGVIPAIGTYLSLSRTFVFFPFFLLGYFLERRHFQWFSKPLNRTIALVIMIVLVLCYTFYFQDISKLWLFASASYSDIGTMEEVGVMVRLVLYLVMFLAVFSFLAFVPKIKLFFTNLGSRTLYVYLLHGLIIKTFHATSINTWILDEKFYVFYLLLGAVLTFILSSRIVNQLTKPIIEPAGYYKNNTHKAA